MSALKRSRFSRRTLLKGAGLTAVGTTAAASVACGTRLGAEQTAMPVAVRVGPPAGTPGTSLVRLTVNGTLYEAAVAPSWTLAEFLRDHLGLTGTKLGCDRGECGSCTVVIEGKAVLSCMVIAAEAAGQTVLTVEGLTSGDELNPLQKSFWQNGAVQCGFCTPGMLMSATALLAANPRPSADDARLAISGNLCRCTGYTKIVEAVVRASQG
jgi:aerobic-type carbon monoxide dehydrogenase small subunit (CoxS/CutS family)